MPQSNLFAEAIADAKAVRATALANAKVALEEAFSQRYHAMFSEKLKEDAQSDLPPPPPEGEDKHQAAAYGVSENDSVSPQEIDELIAELESEVGQADQTNVPPADPNAIPPVDAALPSPAAAPAVPGVNPPVAPTPAVPGAINTTPNLSAPSVPGAVPPAAPAASTVPPIDGSVPPAAPTPPVSDVPQNTDDTTDEEVDLNSLLEELKKEMEEDMEEEINEDTKLASSGIGGKVGVPSGKMPANGTRSSSTIAGGKHQETGIPDGKVTAKEPTNASRPNSIGNGIENTPKLTNENKKETGIPDGTVKAQDPTDAARPNSIGNGIENTPKLEETIKENKNLKKQLSEATEVITYVKNQLNEVNLLNAKLLYTNKLFKEFQLTNEQKMRIVEMFDLNKNVREVRLTYANLAEAMNFSGESKRRVTPNSVQSITEGLASNAVGSTKPSREIISEGKANVMVAKFQKLAGIKPTSNK